MKHVAAVILALVAFSPFARAAEEPHWHATLGDLVKSERAGFGGLSGIVVDPAAGTVWINISDRGFYRSDDQARTFRRCSDNQPNGRTESPGCLLLDPTGASKRLMTAMVYGAPVSVSADGGATWKFFDAKSSHCDWCAVDWTDPDLKFMLALKHESGGALLASRDGGATFAEVRKGCGPGWVFDGKTAVVAEAKTQGRTKPNLLRTTDGGLTWRSCGAYRPVGSNSAQALPKWRDGSLYWLVEGAIIASNNKGETWEHTCAVKDALYGPVFGKDAKHLLVLSGEGVLESIDGGATWSKPIKPPSDLKGVGGLVWLAYDPRNDVIYLMKMGSNLFKVSRGSSATP